MDNKISYSKDKVGKRLKEVRIHLNKTQKGIAALLNISQNALSNYEKGQRYAPYRILVEISQIANVSLDWILTGEGRGLRERGYGEGIPQKNEGSLWITKQGKELLEFLRGEGITRKKDIEEAMKYIKPIKEALDIERIIKALENLQKALEEIREAPLKPNQNLNY